MSTTFMQGWYAVCESTEVGAKKPLGLKRLAMNLVLWRKQSGEVVVMLDRCPHRSAQLSKGYLKDDAIVCPFHGFEFASHGECQHAPEFGKAIKGLCSHSFPSVEKYGMVWVYYGLGEPSVFDFPEVAEIHQQFKGQYTYTTKVWNSHITRCIENQLDYSHLPFVHKNSIGRGFKIPKEPKFVVNERSIEIQFDRDQHARSRYYMANVWNLNISPKTLQMLVYFVPIDETHTEFYLVAYRKFAQLPVLRIPVNWVMNLMNRYILMQDHSVVVSQGAEPSYLFNDELLMRHDQAIKALRQVWQENLVDKNQWQRHLQFR